MQSLLPSGNGKIPFIVLHSYNEIRKGSPCTIRTQSHSGVSALVNQYFWYYLHVRWSPQNKIFVLTTSAEQAWTRSLIQTKSNSSYKTTVWWRITEYFRLRGPLEVTWTSYRLIWASASKLMQPWGKSNCSVIPVQVWIICEGWKPFQVIAWLQHKWRALGV